MYSLSAKIKMLNPNTILQGRYRIVRQLGRGGMGAVYEAIDERLKSVVALKETLIETEEMRRAFEREASLLANLRHPVLPIVTDHFIEGDGQFLVMQMISGDNLEDLLKQRGSPFAPEEVLIWADKLLDALEYLHSRQPSIVHRDIKPSNLKLTPNGEIFLLDFGLAKGSIGQMTTLTSDKSVLGYTPAYAPLEQIHGTGTDHRSDLYSFGATLYHLLTGATPIDAPTRFARVEEGKPDPLRPAHDINSQVQRAASDILLQAMALSRRQRPGSAAELRQALREARQQPQPLPGERDTTLLSSNSISRAELPLPSIFRRRIKLWLGLGVILVLLLSFGLSLWLSKSHLPVRSATPSPTSSVTASVNAWPDSAKRYALIIGVSKYQDTSLRTLTAAANDAKTMKDALVQYAGFPEKQVLLLVSEKPDNAQTMRNSILGALARLAGEVPQDGLLLVYFAGHGFQKEGQTFLITSDTQIGRRDFLIAEETAINTTTLIEGIKRIGLSQVVFIMDSSFGSYGGEGQQPNTDNSLAMSIYKRGFGTNDPKSGVKAFAVLHSASMGHHGYDYTEKNQGYFTWEFVEGLKGPLQIKMVR
jgi:serine/threonine protein kinase